MSIKLVLCDFDGTITTKDVLDQICMLTNDAEKSVLINEAFINGRIDGKTALVSRFKLVEGLRVADIEEHVLSKIRFSTGVKSFFKFALANNIKTVILSGNAEFVLDYFKKELGFSEIHGSKINIVDGVIGKWNEECQCIDKNKVAEEVISTMGVEKSEIISIGDAPSDIPIFNLTGQAFVINKKGDFESKAININSFYDIIDLIG